MERPRGGPIQTNKVLFKRVGQESGWYNSTLPQKKKKKLNNQKLTSRGEPPPKKPIKWVK